MDDTQQTIELLRREYSLTHSEFTGLFQFYSLVQLPLHAVSVDDTGFISVCLQYATTHISQRGRKFCFFVCLFLLKHMHSLCDCNGVQ